MTSPWIRVTMASLFTIVFMTFSFILVGGTIGERIGVVGMMVTLLCSGVIGWLLGARLFKVTPPRA